MTLKHETDVRRLFADYGYTIHDVRRRKHWNVKASRDGGPVIGFTMSLNSLGRRQIHALKRG